MTTMTPEAPTPSPFTDDPFYCLGIADAYDEHAAGEDIHTLNRRFEEMFDVTPADHIPASLYVCGYGNAIAGILNSHIAQINAQTEVAHRWLADTQRRAA